MRCDVALTRVPTRAKYAAAFMALGQCRDIAATGAPGTARDRLGVCGVGGGLRAGAGSRGRRS